METRVYGYARVSSKDQNPERQKQELLAYGVEERNIKIDHESGKDFNRKWYLTLVGTDQTQPELRKGDLLAIVSIDRLGRDYSAIMEQWRHITQTIGADIVVLDMPLLDTRQDTQSLDARFVADLVLQILSYVAEKERQSIRARQKKGIDVAKEQGKHLGRPRAIYPDNWEEVYSQWKRKEVSAVQAMEQLGLKKNTFYKLVKRHEGRFEALE